MTPDNATRSANAQADPLQWWRDARFGMFIHWGIYSVAAGVHRGEQVPSLGEWIRATAKIPFEEYAAYAKGLDLSRFDADHWVALASRAGMKYLVITAKHHDGFAMFQTAAGKFNIVDATPYGRDPMKPLAQACHKYGVKLCFYYSQALDWEDANGGINPPLGTMDGRDLGAYIESKVKTQLRELLTQYGPVGLIWFDTPVHITSEQSQSIAQYVKSLQPACLVSGRIGHDMGDYGSLGDNQVPAGHVKGDWETPATINDTWSFKLHDHNWKSTDLLVRQLVGLAGKGVNFLLNVGPDAHGEIPQPSVERLEQMGQWMNVNHPAIYGTRANPYPYDLSWGAITHKPRKLYLLFTHWPTDPFTLTGLRNRVTGARLLAAPDATLSFSQQRDAAADADTLRLELPPESADPIVTVVELDVEGPVEVDTRLIQQPDGVVTLPAHMASLHIGPAEAPAAQSQADDDDPAKAIEKPHRTASLPISITPSGMIEYWRRTTDSATWRFHITEPGTFAVRVQTVAEKYKPWQGGHTLCVTVEDEVIESEITDGTPITGDRQTYFEEKATEVGEVHLARAGEWELTLSAKRINQTPATGLTVSQLTLCPAPIREGQRL